MVEVRRALCVQDFRTPPSALSAASPPLLHAAFLGGFCVAAPKIEASSRQNDVDSSPAVACRASRVVQSVLRLPVPLMMRPSSPPAATAAQAAETSGAGALPRPAHLAHLASLYPPRDKASRKLWDVLCKFRKRSARTGRKSEPEALELQADSRYVRACIYHFCERLGLETAKVKRETGAKVQTFVVVKLGPNAAPSDGAGPSSSPDASRKRKAESAPGEMAKEGGASSSSAAAAEVAGPSAAERRQFLKELQTCAREDDAAGAMCVYERMEAAGGLPKEAEAQVHNSEQVDALENTRTHTQSIMHRV